MRCLVVGAAGTIGAAVVESLEAKGHTVVGIGGPFSITGRAGYAYSEGIYTALQQELSGIDVIVYAAGRVVPTTHVSPREAIKLDGLPLGELLESLDRTGKQPIVVLISSAGAVYGPSPEHGVLKEEAVLAPLSVYGLVRSFMEELVGFSQRTGKVRGVTLRLSNVYGPGQRVNGPAAFVVRALEAARTGEEMELWGDGQQRKDFVYLDDVVSSVHAAIDWAHARYDWQGHNVFNICRGKSHSLMDVLSAVKEVAGRPVPFRTIPARATDVKRVELSAERATAVLGWTAATRLQDGLQRFWDATAR